MPPVSLREVIRTPSPGARARQHRFANLILVAPLVGAFLQMLVTRSSPWLVWPLLVLASAIVTRWLRTLPFKDERPAVFGVDGIQLEDRFVAVADLVEVQRRRNVFFATTTAKERIELRADTEDVRRAVAIAELLTRAIASADERDTAGERLLASRVPPAITSAVEEAYRAPALDRARCLAVLEDAAASPRARIGAAEHLWRSPDLDDEVLSRMAEAAESTAHRDLRITLREGNDPLANVRAAAAPTTAARTRKEAESRSRGRSTSRR